MPVYNNAKREDLAGLQGNNQSVDIIRENTRKIDFQKNAYPQGVHLNILPPYKVDENGNPQWFKLLHVRTNFGEKFKERYVVTSDNDPVTWFDREVKKKYPDYVEDFKKTVTTSKYKPVPYWGSISKRVLFNAVFSNEYKTGFQSGVQVLELPQAFAANKLAEYHAQKNFKGGYNDWVWLQDKSIPIFFKVDKDATPPWTVRVEDASNAFSLPVELCDPDQQYLYNLDEVFVTKTDTELFEKLKSFIPADIFNDCMTGWNGYGGKTQAAVTRAPAKVLNNDDELPGLEPRAVKSPVFAGPKASAPTKLAPALSNIPKADTKVVERTTELVANPGTPVSPKDVDAALAFLNE